MTISREKKSSIKNDFLISVKPDSEDEEIDDDEESALAVTNVSQIKFFASLLFQFFSRQISSIVFFMDETPTLDETKSVLSNLPSFW